MDRLTLHGLHRVNGLAHCRWVTLTFEHHGPWVGECDHTTEATMVYAWLRANLPAETFRALLTQLPATERTAR